MDHEVNTQVKTSQDTKIDQEETSQEGYMTDSLAIDLKAAYSDLGLTTINNQLQSRSIMSIKEEQRQEEAMMNHTATRKQTRNQHSDQMITEWSTAWQPTLRALERLSCCVYERETSRNGIFGQEGRSQDLKLARRILTEPTRPAPRSLVRLTFDNG